MATRYERGTLRDGKPTGVWDYFDEAGQLELRMNYDSSRIAYRRPDTARYELRVGEEWQLGRPSRTPGTIGSRAGRRASIQKQLRYPLAALQAQLQGPVLLSYVVGTDGHTSAYTIEQSLSPACDQEVFRVVQAQPDQWIPAVYRGRPAAAKFYVLVEFIMARGLSYEQAKADIEQARHQRTVHQMPSSYLDHIFVTALGVERRSGPGPSAR